ncbi:MAG: hypothetical protein AAB683_02085 [Patescibacteria group bacterium]
MQENTPSYIKDLRKDLKEDIITGIKVDIISGLKEHIDNRFEETKGLIESSIEDLAAKTAREFLLVDKRFDKHDIEFNGINNRLDHIESDLVDIKVTIGKIEGHIGRYEIRAQNMDQILLQDHGPRIKELEKVVFA